MVYVLASNKRVPTLTSSEFGHAIRGYVTYVCMYVCMCTCIYRGYVTYICMCVCVCLCVSVCAYHIYIYNRYVGYYLRFQMTAEFELGYSNKVSIAVGYRSRMQVRTCCSRTKVLACWYKSTCLYWYKSTNTDT